MGVQRSRTAADGCTQIRAHLTSWIAPFAGEEQPEGEHAFDCFRCATPRQRFTLYFPKAIRSITQSWMGKISCCVQG
jgi:hypothetical protein